MIGTTLERSKTARESKVRALVFFLTLSVLVHGTFFPQEWLLLGAGMTFFSAWRLWSSSWALQISLTDGLFTGMIALSFMGLLDPIKASEGWLDAVRWLTLWMTYRVACTFQEERHHEVVLRWITGLGTFLALVGLIPFVSRLWPGGIPVMDGRLASLFGYPNALAAYCATVILLKPRSKWIRALLFTSLLNTGSRAAIGIFLLVWISREFLQAFLGGGQPILSTFRVRKERVLLILLLGLGIFFTVRWNQEAVAHLMNWGISTSLGERLLYLQDGLHLAVINKGLPRAGGWFAFPLIQNIPYWTTDPHSLLVRVLLHQGLLGFILLGGWGIWFFWNLWGKLLGMLRQKRGSSLTFVRGFSALFFLMVHSLVDTDFLFGALGFLYWALFGMLCSSPLGKGGRRRKHYIESYYIRNQGILGKRGIRYVSSIFFLGLGLLLVTTAANPQWIERENQTQPKMRQGVARLEVEQRGSDGLAAMEDVLAWEKFDLRTYEWAQGVVFEEAEKRKEKSPEEARELYRWVARVPERIASVQEISAFEKKLWPEVKEFQPSEFNFLLADYANERQLTLP